MTFEAFPEYDAHVSRWQIATKMPRVQFVFRRDVFAGPYRWEAGVYWGRDLSAKPFEIVYRRWVVLRWRLRIEHHAWTSVRLKDNQ